DGLLRHLDDPQVRLVRDQQLHVRGRHAVCLERGCHRLRHEHRSELEDFAAFHHRAMLPLLDQLGADEGIVRQAGGVDPQLLGVAAVGVEVGREHAAPGVGGGSGGRGYGAVAEQHGGVAAPRRPVEPAGMHLRTHEQHAPVLTRPDPRVGHGQPVHESRALVADIDGGNVADPELTLEEDAVAGLEVVGGAGRVDDAVQVRGLHAGLRERLEGRPSCQRDAVRGARQLPDGPTKGLDGAPRPTGDDRYVLHLTYEEATALNELCAWNVHTDAGGGVTPESKVFDDLVKAILTHPDY